MAFGRLLSTDECTCKALENVPSSLLQDTDFPPHLLDFTCLIDDRLQRLS
jgi:hypothetical protein